MKPVLSGHRAPDRMLTAVRTPTERCLPCICTMRSHAPDRPHACAWAWFMGMGMGMGIMGMGIMGSDPRAETGGNRHASTAHAPRMHAAGRRARPPCHVHATHLVVNVESIARDGIFHHGERVDHRLEVRRPLLLVSLDRREALRGVVEGVEVARHPLSADDQRMLRSVIELRGCMREG